MNPAPEVILVNHNDDAVGTMEKMEAHVKGLLHRAFSIFIFNEHGEMLLQQRADNKYHSPGLWTNACCSHPFPEELIEDAAHRRLIEELGFDTDLKKIFHFTYKASFENGLIEHEFDHVFTGEFNGNIYANTDEVKAHHFVSLEKLRNSLAIYPEQYTEWFKIAFPKLEDYLAQNKS